MPQRTISTKIAIDGESEYKASLKNINTSLTTLKSELKNTESQFLGHANSYEALASKGAVLSKQYDAQQEKVKILKNALESAQQAQQTYSQRVADAQDNIRRCEAALEELKNTEGDTTEEQAKLTAELEGYKKELSEAEKYEEAAANKCESYQTQVNNAEAELNKFGYEIDKNNLYMMEAENRSDGLAVSIDELGHSVNAEAKLQKEAKEKEKEHEEQMQKLGAVATAIGATVATAFTAMTAAAVKLGSALVDMTKGGAEYADNVLTMSTVTGIGTDSLQAYMYAADLVDVSTETLSKPMAKQIKSMGSYVDGSKSYVDAYDRLGVSVTDADGHLRDSETVYWELIDALGQMENETERDELAMTLLGKSGQELNPIIEAGSERMKELAAEAENAGYIMGEDTLQAYGALQDNLDRLSAGSEAAKNALGTALLPMLTQLSGDGVEMLNSFTRAIQDCDGDLGKMAEVAGDYMEKIVDKVAEYAPEFINLAVEVVEGLANGILKNIPQLVTVVSDIIPEIVGVLIEALPALNDAALSIIMALVNGIIEVLPALLEAAAQIIAQLVTGIAEALPELIPAAVSAITQLVQALIDNIPLLIDAALQLVTGLAEGVIEAIPVLLDALPTLIESLINALLDAIPMIIDTGVTLLVALVENLPTIIQKIVAVLPQIINSVISTLLSHIPEIIQAGIRLLTSLIENLPQIIITIVQALPQIITSVVQALVDNIPLIVQTGVQLLTSLITNLPQIIAQIVRSMPQIISGIVSALSQGVGQIAQVGANLVRGLWQGIQSLAGWLWNMVSGWISSIWDGILNFFGIHSPSTKFAWVSEMNIKGAAQSIEKNGGEAVEAYEKWGADMLDAAEEQAGKINTALADTLGDLETGISAKATIEQVAASTPTLTDRRGTPAGASGGDTTVKNEFHIAELVVREEADVEKVARKLYKMQKSKSRGKGVVVA